MVAVANGAGETRPATGTRSGKGAADAVNAVGECQGGDEKAVGGGAGGKAKAVGWDAVGDANAVRERTPSE